MNPKKNDELLNRNWPCWAMLGFRECFRCVLKSAYLEIARISYSYNIYVDVLDMKGLLQTVAECAVPGDSSSRKSLEAKLGPPEGARQRLQSTQQEAR